MDNSLKKTLTSELCKNISLLNATQFENVCDTLLSCEKNSTILHRGLTIDEKPVGYIVDSFDQKFKIAAEYSTQLGYFKSPYKKIYNDITHALETFPDLEELSLFSNEDCPNSTWPEIDKITKSYKFTILIHDKRLIAEKIIKIIDRQEIINLKEYLPAIKILEELYIFSNNIPAFENNFDDIDNQKKLSDAIQQIPIVLIHGLSGSGKSYLAQWYAKENKKEFENIFWIEGKDLESTTSFSNITITRLGIACNLKGKFNTGKNLLVIDSMEKSSTDYLLNDLKPGIEKGGKIIITSQVEFIIKNSISILINSVGDQCALKILSPQDDNITDTKRSIIKHVGNHPLTLNIINSIVLNEEISYEDILKSIADIPRLECPDNTTLLTKLIKKTFSKNKISIYKIKWLKSHFFDEKFLYSFCGLEYLNLKKNAIIYKYGNENYNIYKIHDLIYSCLQNLTDITKDQEEEFFNCFSSFFKNKINSNDYHFQRSLQFCADRIQQCAFNSNDSLMCYLYILIDGINKDEQFLEQWAKRNIEEKIDDLMAIHAIFESKEKMSFQYKIQYDEQNISEIEKILQSKINISSETHHVLYHHYGKSLKKSHKKEKAIMAFKKALEYVPNAPHSLLQLARISNNEEKLEYLNQIYTQYQTGDSISITVLLATVNEILRNKYCKDEFLNRYKDFPQTVQKLVYLSIAEGYSQPFEKISLIGQNLWFNDPECLIKNFGITMFPQMGDADDFSTGNIMKNYGKALFELDEKTKAVEIFKEACNYFELALNGERLNGYKLTMIAEGFILSKDFKRALEILAICSDTDKGLHYHHRKSQALSGIRKLNEAIEEIDYAISSCIDDNEKYKAAFIECKAQIYYDNDQKENAVKYWTEASQYTDGKFKNKILEKIKVAI